MWRTRTGSRPRNCKKFWTCKVAVAILCNRELWTAPPPALRRLMDNNSSLELLSKSMFLVQLLLNIPQSFPLWISTVSSGVFCALIFTKPFGILIGKFAWSSTVEIWKFFLKKETSWYLLISVSFCQSLCNIVFGLGAWFQSRGWTC